MGGVLTDTCFSARCGGLSFVFFESIVRRARQLGAARLMSRRFLTLSRHKHNASAVPAVALLWPVRVFVAPTAVPACVPHIRYVYNEVNNRFPSLPFSLRALEDEKQVRALA